MRLNGSPAQLASVWAPENGGSPADFLAQWEQSPATAGAIEISRGQRDGHGLFHGHLPVSERRRKMVCPAIAAGRMPRRPRRWKREIATPTGDAALKQKLDCVLQLARTVSLDFNNALTGVLAHTSLLLGKAEPEHPWRRSLLEVEKSAARAAEIASELAQFSRQEKETRRAPAGNLNAVVGPVRGFFPQRPRRAVQLEADAGTVACLRRGLTRRRCSRR